MKRVASEDAQIQDKSKSGKSVMNWGKKVRGVLALNSGEKGKKLTTKSLVQIEWRTEKK